MKSQNIKVAMNKDSAPESEEQKFKQKCKELKKRIIEVEESNEISTIALSRTKAAIRRLRLEYSILLERLEDRVVMIPNGNYDEEDMTPPPSPTILDESLNSSNTKLTRNGLSKKGKRGKTGANLAGTGGGPNRVQKIRDPDLPKRPTNAYLIFCEMEKERIKKELEEKSPGAVTDLSKTLTENWKNLNDEERKPYYKLYEDDRERYQREMVVYNQKKQIETDEKRLNKRQKLDGTATLDDSNLKTDSKIDALGNDVANRDRHTTGEDDGAEANAVNPNLNTVMNETQTLDKSNEPDLNSEDSKDH